MREMILKKVLPLLLCAVLLVGFVPLDVHAGEAAGLTQEQRQWVTGRRMDDWYFPLPEEFFDDIADLAGCRGWSENALYAGANSSCTQQDHNYLAWGSEHMAVNVGGTEQVYAPASGTLYRCAQPHAVWGEVVVLEVPVDGVYSYYILMGTFSSDLTSGAYVEAGSPIGYTFGTFRCAAMMDYAGQGNQISADVTAELNYMQGMGWLLSDTGTGLVCVNPAADTYTRYPSSLVSSFGGPIHYRFVSNELPQETAHTQHSWDGGVMITPPTHTSEGISRNTCTVCGEYIDQVLPADTDAHVYDQQVAAQQYLAAAANCAGGAKYYYSCVCGAAGTETFAYGEASGDHVWNSGEVITPATHTADGIMRYTCTVCGTVYDGTLPADTGAHVYDQQVADQRYLAAAANCAGGAKYYYSCVCGAAGTETFVYGGASGDHLWDAGETIVYATHTSDGLVRYTCAVCGTTYDSPLPANASHSFDQEVVSDQYLAEAATCDSPARYYYSCACGEKGTTTFTYGQAASHSFDSQWSYDENNHWHKATCQHTGEIADFAPHRWDEGQLTQNAGHNVNGEKRYTCLDCGYQTVVSIPGQPHEYIIEDPSSQYLASEATCTSPALYYKRCVCGAVGTETFYYGEAKGHTFSDQWSSDDTWHWQGATCGHTDQRIKLAEHIWNPGVITVQPTATTKGVKTYTCSVCGRTKTEEVEPSTHQHTFSPNWAGNSTYHWHDSTCEHTNVVDGLGEHIWNEGVVTAWPTHDAAGSKVFTCSICGMQKTETISQTHTYDRQVASDAFLASRATCVSPASYYYSCTCGAKDTTRTFTYGSALGHVASSSWGKDANYHWTVCSRCGVKGDLIAHSFDSNGVCTVCGGSKQDAHIHASHLSRVPAKAATCTQEGNITYFICDCGMWFSDAATTQVINDRQSVVLPAQGHVDADNNGRCDVCKERMDNVVEYQMTEGGESTWLNTSGQGLVFRTNADFAKFDHVEVDGGTVAETNYSVSQGSTIVELNASYLKRLSLGRHTISIVAKDGKATTGFTIKQGAVSGVGGQNGGNGIWRIILVLTVVIAMAIPITYGVYYYRRRTNGGYT